MLKRMVLDLGTEASENTGAGEGTAGGGERDGREEKEDIGLETLIKQLAAEGIALEWEEEGSSMPEREENGVLYLTDRPERVWERHGTDCCILLYLTEGNRKDGFGRIPYAVGSLDGLTADFLKKVWQRHMGEPWEILQTKRLKVREMTIQDLDALYEIYGDPDMTLYTEGPDGDRGAEREKLAAYIRNVYPMYGFGLWMLEERESGRCIGRAGFFWREDAAYPELGFAVEKGCWGKGYCLEACRAILKYGFEELGFSGVQAVVKEGNEASEGVLRRLGFEEEGKEVWEGETVHVYIMQ